MPAPTPTFIPEPFAQSGDRASIPDTVDDSTGRASWHSGFPPITMEAKVAGGKPPDGRDVNGTLWVLSGHAYYAQAGQLFTYSVNVSTAVGGYALGAVLASADGKTVWFNTADDNTADPDSAGTGWVSLFTNGSITIPGLTGGIRTLTRLESRFGQIVINGSLASNQTIIMPNDKREWRFINNCTGSFTVTVKTASGDGVVVPQGGPSNSTGLFGDGTDIYLDTAPVSFPVAVTPDPNTALQRDNVGDGFCRYFNSSSSPEVLAIQNVIVTNGSDGYYRKISITNFEQQLLLSAINGQVVNAQVPKSAVAQWSPVTTNGNGTAITLPNGYVDQFGSVHGGNIPPSPTPLTVNITFPVAFPTAIDDLQVTIQDPSTGVGGVFAPIIVSMSRTGATICVNELNSGVQDVTFRWRAIGH